MASDDTGAFLERMMIGSQKPFANRRHDGECFSHSYLLTATKWTLLKISLQKLVVWWPRETKLVATQVSWVHVRALIGKESDPVIWSQDIRVLSPKNLDPPTHKSPYLCWLVEAPHSPSVRMKQLLLAWKASNDIIVAVALQHGARPHDKSI